MLTILLHWLSAPALVPVAVPVPARKRKRDR